MRNSSNKIVLHAVKFIEEVFQNKYADVLYIIVNLPIQIEIIFTVLIAVVLGGIIGLERELAGKPAGFRTHMLIAGAAAFLVELTQIVILTSRSTALSDSLIVQADPIRIIQAIIVGVSFIGAGTIIQRKVEERIEGLTTAASILFTTGVGIAVAYDQYIASIGVTLIILIINYVLGFIPDWLKNKFSKKQ